jgi:DNA-binding LacI/PurR family transcriptional regulator
MAAPTVGDVDRVLQEILDYQVDGLVLASVSMSSSLAGECQALGIPVVLLNRAQDDARLSNVVTDNRAGGRAVAEHLVALGHRRIGYVAGFEGASTQRARERGFREGLAAAGLDLAARGDGNFERAGAEAATRRMFGGPDRPDAVFVCNDHMAFAVMDVLRYELGLRVPEDVAVAGFDDTPLAAWRCFSLTTYRQPVNRMVAETVTTLLELIEDKERGPRRVTLDGRLVVRGSTQRQEGTPT